MKNERVTVETCDNGRRVWKIDINGLSKQKAIKILNELAEDYKKKFTKVKK